MSASKRSCFFITPIGNKGSETYRNTEGLLDSIINPVMKDLNYSVEVAHKISETGSINNQIIDRIVKSDLIIANLTELNPNVFYELGLSHAIGKQVIIIAQQGTKLPFDIIKERTIFYDNDIAGVHSLTIELKTMVNGIDYIENAKNPFYDAIRVNQINDKVSKTESEVDDESILQILLEEITDLKKQFSYQLNRNLKKNRILHDEASAVMTITFDTTDELTEFKISKEFNSLIKFIDVMYGAEAKVNRKTRSIEIYVRIRNGNYNEIEEFLIDLMSEKKYNFNIIPQV